jgi:hypothetical protein
MATVVLDELWLHDAADYSDSVRFKVATTVASQERTVSRRRRANGRLVMVSSPTSPVEVEVTAELLSRETLDKLTSFMGRRLLYRDTRGRVMFGFFPELAVTEVRPTRTHTAVSFSFLQVTGTVAV